MHYWAVVDDIRGVREASARLADDVRALDAADLERATVDHIRAELDALEQRLAPVEELLAADPLVSLARGIAAVAPQVEAADSLVEAGSSLVEAGQIGLGLADRVVDLREADAADPEVALMPGLVELMATSGEQVDRVAELLADARTALDAIPEEAVSQIREARDLVAGPIASYAPLLDTYRELDDVLPGLLGWGDEKRYLVLAQNPAELRPSGGYTGTVGTITLRDGAIVEQDFVDTYGLSVQEGLPFVDPPDELTAYLLGEGQSWRLADANWSPDFPTVARKAAELYGIETGQEDIDGVIAITTYALDRLLEVTGPVEVPEYGVTVQPGDVTMTLLGATRGTAELDRGTQGHPGRTGHRDPEPPAVPAAGALGGDPGRAGGHQHGAIGPRLAGRRGRPGAGRGLGLGWSRPPGSRRLPVRRRVERGSDLQVQPRRRPRRLAVRDPGRDRHGHQPAAPRLAEPGRGARRAV